MSGLISLFEPEELFGEYWHRFVGDVGREQRHIDAGVDFDEVSKSLGVLFRGLGGNSGVAIKPIARRNIEYRQNFLTRIVHGSNEVSQSKFDGDFLYLPERIEILPQKKLNSDIYTWLTAWNAIIGDRLPENHSDPLQNDISYLRFSYKITQQVQLEYRGLVNVYSRLVTALLAARSKRSLPLQQQSIETAIHAVLMGDEPENLNDVTRKILEAILTPEIDISKFKAARNYQTFLPFILFGEVTANSREAAIPRRNPEETSQSSNEASDEKSKKGRRRKSDQIENKDSLILHRFESILSWSEMMNIPRAVDDDDEDTAKRAADDQNEIGLANLTKKASTKLKFDLDLAPDDVEIERLSDTHTYPEWDYRLNGYHNDHCRVLANKSPTPIGTNWQPDKEARKRIRAVKRQFEALRPRREKTYNQIDGSDIDFNALIRSHCDAIATGEGTDRVFINSKEETRDLSVSVLIDVSRSSESWVEGRQVIDISKEALIALTMGLAACGDSNAIYSFSSLKRDRVYVSTIKQFDEVAGPAIYARIGALKPGFYTRLGAAIRHVNKELMATASTRKLLIVLSDGKPNDLDHYEGRYGIEDSAIAVREARRSGISVFGITIDKKAQSYFPHIFGRNAFAITSHANDLISALPRIYRHLVT